MDGWRSGPTRMPAEMNCATLTVNGEAQMPSQKSTSRDLQDLAERHAKEAERLLATRWLSSHVKGQLHATLALYYSMKHRDGDG
jgi:hypothetical protein